uniref:Immunodominant membrane protein n=1 Tax=Candidatus Phytoplasma citri TaxID=180978 RepID=A0A0K3ASS0_9MOLU|nr:Immunodominant membrane protein [Candidatus Phytoplasma aurantifolia]CTQ47840.1 Immunodominant membrane protein [Candidatus Phytoplasma aurantifolia]
MNHKENFLQTKNGKITVGVLASLGIAIVVYLIAAKLLHWKPFNITTLTNKDIENLKVDLKDLSGKQRVADLSSDDAKKEGQKAVDGLKKIIDAFAENNKADDKDKKISSATMQSANDLKTKADDALKFVNEESADPKEWNDADVVNFVNNKMVKASEINDLLNKAKSDLKLS